MADRINPLGMTEEDTLRAAADQAGRVASAGAPVPVDPDVADFMGAFEDDAIDFADALESRFDDVAEGE